MDKLTLVLLLTAFITSSCTHGPNSPKGFSLPAGNVENGEAAFRKFNCIACHAMTGFDRGNIKQEHSPLIVLGGELNHIVTYADLVTSIINPSHRLAKGYKPFEVRTDGKSNMRNYNDEMTVTELINLVSFLQPKYSLRKYEHTQYGHYGIYP